MATCTRRCLLLLALAASAASERPATDAASIEEDDECQSGDESCAVNAVQLRARGSARRHEAGLEASCHDARPGEDCYDEMMLAKYDGLGGNSEWFASNGITRESSDAELQLFVHETQPQQCPRPCFVVQLRPWCLANAMAPALWAPAQAAAPVSIKILSYNLFWWSLFGLRNGNGNSAGALIKQFNEPQAFDVMGFQECEGPARVLNPVGLDKVFEAIVSPHGICMAYNKLAWVLLGSGAADVSEDMPTRYYGRRAIQWMRLAHRTTGVKLFFVNHHGPLSVNSGGLCGGQATANNILQVMAKNALVGDVLVLVGDFNANAASLTIQTLWSNLVQAFAGKSFGGVDNIFSNVASSDVVESQAMGTGGSDHEAIYAVLQLGAPATARGPVLRASEPAAVHAAKALVGDAKPGVAWQDFWCGQLEDQTAFVYEGSFWNRTVTGDAALSPEHCCRECQATGVECQSWMWMDYAMEVQGRWCLLNGNPSPARKPATGLVSGLAYTAAASHALQAAFSAKRTM